jgi:hypothetical protein
VGLRLIDSQENHMTAKSGYLPRALHNAISEKCPSRPTKPRDSAAASQREPWSVSDILLGFSHPRALA